MFFTDICFLTTYLTVCILRNVTPDDLPIFVCALFGNYVVHKNKKILDFSDTRGFKKKKEISPKI